MSSFGIAAIVGISALCACVPAGGPRTEVKGLPQDTVVVNTRRPSGPGDEFFPRNVLGPPEDSFIRNTIAEYLKAAGEAPLFVFKHPVREVYRAVLIGGFGGALVVRVDRAEESWRLTCEVVGKVRAGATQAPGLIKKSLSRTLDAAETANLQSLLEGGDFWMARSWSHCHEPKFPGTIGGCLDGDWFLLEGRREGTDGPAYHVAMRDIDPPDAVQFIANELLRLGRVGNGCDVEW
jgi:hypothetical protein